MVRIVYELPAKSKWSVGLTVYQSQLHLVTFWEVIECNLCEPHVRIHGSTQCAVGKAPTGSQPLTMLIFLNFFFKEIRIKCWIGSKKYAETWEFGLRKFNKSQNGQFWLRNLVLPICATGCYTDGWGRRGKAAVGGYWVQSFKEPHFVPPILELWSDERDEVMICAGTDLQWFFTVCTNGMM